MNSEILDSILNKNEFNPGIMSKFLYGVILNAFRTKINMDERKLYYSYIGYMYDIIEYLREQPIDKILEVMKKYYAIDEYIVDNLIMLWSFPRSEQYMSKLMYYRAYEDNINAYNNILYEMRNEDFVINFCIDIIAKPSKCPIHCIDILWNCIDINDIEIDTVFLNTKKYDYIEFNLDEEESTDKIHIELNADRLTEFNLGNKKNSKGISFNDMIRSKTQ